MRRLTVLAIVAGLTLLAASSVYATGRHCAYWYRHTYNLGTTPPGAAAQAEMFSAPVRLPKGTNEWRFAVNDRGEAVGVLPSGKHVMVAQLASSGRIKHLWPLPLPAHVAEAIQVSIELSERGDAAVGVLYNDGQRAPEGDYPHKGPGCCRHIAIATWQLGKRPPEAQAVSPELNPVTEVGNQPWHAPVMVVGRSDVTALWIRGDEDPYVQAEDQIEEAFGRIETPLRTAQLLAVSGAVNFLNLQLAPDGRPIANWIDDGDIIRTVTGRSSGALRSPTRSQGIHGYGSGLGFSHDSEGHTVFAYLSGPPEGTRRLVAITSTNGGRFRHARVIAPIPANSSTPSLYADGHGFLLVTWTHTRQSHFTMHFEALRGSVGGGFTRPVQLGELPLSESDFTGFLDSEGQAVIIQPRRAAHHFHGYELVALTAQSDRSFERPRPIASQLLDCGIDKEAFVASPNGHAVLVVDCNEGSGQRGSQYLIRYTP